VTYSEEEARADRDALAGCYPDRVACLYKAEGGFDWLVTCEGSDGTWLFRSSEEVAPRVLGILHARFFGQGADALDPWSAYSPRDREALLDIVAALGADPDADPYPDFPRD